MDARSAARSAGVRGVCLAAAMLFALGVFTGVVSRSDDHTHHRHGHVTASATLADTLDGAVRSTQAAVVTPATQGVTLRVAAIATAESSRSSDQSGIDVPRQRGPPAITA